MFSDKNGHMMREKMPWLWLSLFVLLFAAGSGTLLILYPLQTHANKQYLLTGHTVFAFEGGRMLWHHSLPAFKMSDPTTLLVEDRLYVAAGSVYALDKETGRLLWQQQIPFIGAFLRGTQIATALFWKEGRLYVETDAQSLLRLDPQNGVILWEYAEEEAEISPPAFSSRGDVIYVITRQQRGETAYEVTAIKKEQRRLLWQQHFILPAQWGKLEAPIVEDELVLVPLGDMVVVLRTSDGHRLPS
jgi:outer membrane protein assembly factor BamB